MRATYHSGRAGKSGAYLPQHNDRTGSLGAHIDENRSAGNRYWMCCDAGSFEECEARFYARHFGAALDARNARYAAQRHPERVRSMDDYRKNPRSCPEETIWQLGKLGETVDAETLWSVVCDVLSWQAKAYPQCKLLTAAMHVDEEGAPHVHVRQVWIAHDKCDHEVVGQAAALREMGVERPDPERPEGRYNCAKIAFSAAVRARLQAIAREHGVELETTPKERSQVGLSLTEYQARQEEAKAEAAQEAARAAQEAAWAAQKAEADHAAGADALERIEGMVEAVAQMESEPVVETLRTLPARRGVLGIGKRPELAVVDAGELAQVQIGADLREGMQRAARELQTATRQLRAAARARHITPHEADLARIEAAERRAVEAERLAREAKEAAKVAQERAEAAEARAQAAEERAAWADPELLKAVAAYAKRERLTAEALAGIGQSRDASRHRAIETAIRRR